VHDCLFRNALIFDGTGGSPAIGDVAVTDGRIAAMGMALAAPARTACRLQQLERVLMSCHQHGRPPVLL
jgi:N-acyl-D-aspartate/D-glutamate deacylase